MAPEVEALIEIDHIVSFVRIPFFQFLQDVNLDESLLMKSFLVSDDLDGDELPRLVIYATDHLPKATFSE